MLLAIDTATRYMSLALHDGNSLLAEQTWPTDNNHSVELAPSVRTLLQRCEVSIEQLTGVAVSIGPGSYTGLRIGVALAKGIASARKLPLVGISTLDILAAGHPQVRGGLVAVVQAGRGRIIAASYRWRKESWAQRSEPMLMDWETLIASIDGPAHITGEVDEQGRAAIENTQDQAWPMTLAPAAYRLRRAGFLADEAWSLLRGGKPEQFEAARVTPVYVKTKDTP
ncbi:MAG: tRNA (adenosine(37)-N6)-threonylcarbamoyltransferase complex dimerization subunit type 1 TsaB [Burkholderiales bacterium]|nr:tRNA (adenosine(37)-N6)-threonylcarbamoyltransferase complex dimerization subunit type 1 TsaB [Anaerolineae bacterium]